jgi:DNA (cytosine-5)-methyltransferase 1
MNYYNENDKFATGWLRALIDAGLIPNGDVDERSIADVQPQDLKGYTQCHFFAGIGGWPYALKLAQWPSTRPVWTGSCPCQPLSVAGLGQGAEDEKGRHLWPEFARLICECEPPVIFGEQVASALGRQWLTGVRLDLEEMGYAVGAADLCAAGIGAPHIRQRLFWVADADTKRLGETWTSGSDRRLVAQSPDGRLGNAESNGRRQKYQNKGRGAEGNEQERCLQRPWDNSIAIPCADGKWRRVPDGMVQPNGNGLQPWGEAAPAARHGDTVESTSSKIGNGEHEVKSSILDVVDGLSAFLDADWIQGSVDREGQIRRLQNGVAIITEGMTTMFPLCGTVPGRAGILRGAGNAIVGQLAAELIKAFLEVTR